MTFAQAYGHVVRPNGYEDCLFSSSQVIYHIKHMVPYSQNLIKIFIVFDQGLYKESLKELG